MFRRVNALRRAAGLQPFERHSALDAAARTHSADMAWHDELTHVSDRTGDPAARVAAAGLAAASVGENIARNRDALSAHQALVASEPHLANLVSADYSHIGIAVYAADEGEVWVTQVFARLETEDAPSRAEVDTPPAPAEPEAPDAPAEPAEPIPAAPLVGTPYVGGAVVGASGTGGAGRRVIGYWVQSHGRWFYYRLPPNAQHGQELEPDLNVVGPPPGYGAGVYPSGTRVPTHAAPAHYYGGHSGRRVVPQTPPPFGWSPRRHYPQWRGHQ